MLKLVIFVLIPQHIIFHVLFIFDADILANCSIANKSLDNVIPRVFAVNKIAKKSTITIEISTVTPAKNPSKNYTLRAINDCN